MEEQLRKTRALLFGLLNNYSPPWHYEMGKTGYECSFCNAMIHNSADFSKADEHNKGCAWVAANALRFEPNPLLSDNSSRESHVQR